MVVAVKGDRSCEAMSAPQQRRAGSVANDNEIRRFRADLEHNPELATAVFAQGTDLAGVAELANAFGYTFTADAFEDVLRSRTRRILDDRELAQKGGSWVRMGAPGCPPAYVWIVDSPAFASVYVAESVGFFGLHRNDA